MDSAWWMATLLHNLPEANPFDQKVQEAELDCLLHSPAAPTPLAEN